MKKLFPMALAAILPMLFWPVFPTAAAEFPSKPITLVVGFGPGGMTDVVGRILAFKMEEFLKQRIIVENKPGAGGYIALKSVLESPADGYTFVSYSTSTAASTILLDKPIPIETIGLLGSSMAQERVMFAKKGAPFKTFQGFVEYAKKNPVSFAGGGSLWTDQVVEAMAKELNLKVNFVPFRSGAEGSAAILGGHVMTAETGVGPPAWHAGIKGDLVILAVLSDGHIRDFGFPGVKNLKELGVSYFSRQKYGFALPAKVPAERREKLEKALKYAVEHPEAAKKIRDLDLVAEFLPAKEYHGIIQSTLKEAAELRSFLKK